MTSDQVYKLIEDNGLTLHGDIEHFAELVAAKERARIVELVDGYDGWIARQISGEPEETMPDVDRALQGTKMTGFGKAPIKAEGEPMFTPEQIAAAEKLAAFSHGGEKLKENAYNELLDFLEEGETVEAIVFGEWGWGGYKEPKNSIKQGVLLTLEEAKPMMESWAFYGGYGSPECPATNIWTNRRVIWVTQDNGSTTLDSALRNPANCMPEMPGG